MRITLPAVAMMFAASTTASAQAGSASATPVVGPSAVADSPILWRDLQAGATVDQVSTRLSAYPEVKSVKPKAAKKGRSPSLKVGMKDGGIPVYGSSFSLRPSFGASGNLVDVTLVSESECANDAPEKVARMVETLSAKYGPELTGADPLGAAQMSSALYRAYVSERTDTITYGFANESVAVALVIGFSKAKPPVYAGGGSVARALYGLAHSLYEAQKQKCGNTGDETVTYGIRYLTREAFDKGLAELNRQRDAEDEEADDNL